MVDEMENDRLSVQDGSEPETGGIGATANSDQLNMGQIEGKVIEALREIFDPEIPVNIYELGLIYDVSVTSMNEVRIQMTLTTPHCPVAESLPAEVEAKTKTVDGVTDAFVELVWEPQWTPDRMSEAARLELGFM
tara:strand:- start:217 stop:621 length:405 start_codon:yes stop_codon:yes gene_type:complete